MKAFQVLRLGGSTRVWPQGVWPLECCGNHHGGVCDRIRDGSPLSNTDPVSIRALIVPPVNTSPSVGPYQMFVSSFVSGPLFPLLTNLQGLAVLSIKSVLSVVHP